MKIKITALALLFFTPAIFAQIDKYFPVDYKVTRVYETSKKRAYVLPNGKQEDTITGTSVESFIKNVYDFIEVEGKFLFQQEINEKSSKTGNASSVILHTVMSKDVEKVLMHAQMPKATDVMEEKLTRFDPPVVMIDFQSVKSNESFDSTFSMQGMTMSMNRYEYSYLDLETPSGSYSDVLRVRSKGTISGEIRGPGGQAMPITGGKLTETIWLAPGVGIVKQEQSMEMSFTVGNGMSITSVEDKIKILKEIRKK